MPTYKVYITSRAHHDLSECVSFVLRVSKEAAINLAKEIYSAIESLDEFPERFPIFGMPKPFPVVVRKCIVNKTYIILYGIESDKVVVYRILDSRRKFSYLVD